MGGGIYRHICCSTRMSVWGMSPIIQIKVAPHKEISSDYKTAEAIIYVLCGCSGLKFQAFLKANFQATERKKTSNYITGSILNLMCGAWEMRVLKKEWKTFKLHYWISGIMYLVKLGKDRKVSFWLCWFGLDYSLVFLALVSLKERKV